MRHRAILFAFLLPGIIMISCQQQKKTITQTRGLAFAEDFINLPYLKTGIQTYQNSSTDPAEDQFNDNFHWLYSDSDSNAVLADIEGPGSLYRIWSTGNSGDTNRIKIYIDGKESPVLDETFNDFHSSPPLRDRPQVGSGAGDNYLAWWSYMPIPFQKSCKIVREGNFRPFYNITYHTYTDTTGVRSWNGSEDVTRLEKLWSNTENDPKPREGNITKAVKTTIAPKQTFDVLNQEGAGYIASLKIANYPADKNFRIRIYWDHENVPSVDAPVKWFFGSVDNGGDVKALGIGTVNGHGYCYFPMPFWKNAKIELVNMSDTVAADVDIEVQYNKNVYEESEAAYFHAQANEVEKPGKKYSCLTTQGRGHVIGMAKRMPKGGHACEADEIFYIDDRKFPDIYGTGEEDYANCAWWKNKYNSYPTHGHVGNDCYYRIHYPDLIIYEKALDMQFESWQDYYIASVVWYYEKDKSVLVHTDSLDINDAISEKGHGYKITGQTWEGEKEGIYPGRRIYADTLKDDGRSFDGQSEFTLKVDPKNHGVRLRVRTDNENFQRVDVYIDDVRVEERSWYVAKNNFEATWVDSDFEIPERYTTGKEKVTVLLRRTSSGKPWSEYRYDVYSYAIE
jgi:hypothetical protein